MGDVNGTNDAEPGGPPVTEPVQGGQESPPKPQQRPRRQRYVGGTKGAKKPSKLLKDMRWCYLNKPTPGETLTPGRAQCRQLQKDDQFQFMKMLKDLEKAFAGLRTKPPASGSTTTGAPASGIPGPTDSLPPDQGELTVLEVIDKLCAGFGPEGAD